MAEKTIIGFSTDSSGGGSLTPTAGPLYVTFNNEKSATPELDAQLKIRGAATLRNMRVSVISNTFSAGPSAIITRINGVSGNMTVSIGAGISGAFSDLSNTDTLAAGDLFDWMITTPGSGTGVLTVGSIANEFETSGQAFTQLVGSGGSPQNVNQGATTFPVCCGTGAFTTENTGAQWAAVETATISDAQVRVKTNTASGAATVKSRKNGADGNILISVTAGSTGLFEDITHTDSIVAGDLINFSFSVAAGTGTVGFMRWSFKHTGSVANRTTLPFKDPNDSTSTASQIRYGAPWAKPPSLTANTIFIYMPTAGTLSGFRVLVQSNARTTTTTCAVRKANADGNQAISIGAGVTGQLSDATNSDSYAVGDILNVRITTGTGVGAISVNSWAIIFQAAQVFNQSAQASTTPVASRTAAIAHALALAVSIAATASLTRANAIIRTVSIAATAALRLASAKSSQASTSPIASLSRSAGRTLRASTSPVSGLSTAASHVLALLASTGPVASIRRAVAMVRSVAVTTTPGLARASGKSITSVTNPVASLRRATGHGAQGSTTPVSSLRRAMAPLGIGRVNVSAIASLVRSMGLSARQASSTPVSSLSRATGHAASATTGPTASTVHQVGKNAQASTSPVASLVRAAGKRVQAITAPIGSLARSVILSVRQAVTGPSATLSRSSTRWPLASTSPTATVVRQTGKRAQASTVPAGTLSRVLLRSFQAVAQVVASRTITVGLVRTAVAAVTAGLARATGKPLGADVAAIPSAGKGSFRSFNASTTPVASLTRSMLIQIQAVAAAVASMTKRLFHLPDECSIIVLPAQETVIMFESCELKTGQFPARYTPESRLYGVDFSRRLDGSEVIDIPSVSLMDGDIIISDVYNNDSVVTFRLTGGSPVYQRLAIRVTTTATPPNIYQGEATIACYP